MKQPKSPNSKGKKTVEFNLSEEGGFETFIDHLKAGETKYFDEALERIEKQVQPLFMKAYNHQLEREELMLLRRQLQQALFAYEEAIRSDKFDFAAQPHLGERLFAERSKAVLSLKSALTIVETKLQDEQFHTRESKKKKTTAPDFKYYIKEGLRERLLPILKKHYTATQPDTITAMLFALNDMDYLVDGTLTNNKSELHRALTATFGDIGGQRALTIAINRYSNAPLVYHTAIELNRNHIKGELEARELNR